MSKFRVARRLPTLALRGDSNLSTGGIQYTTGISPPQWITTPSPTFVEGYIGQVYDLASHVGNYSSTTDVFSLAPGSVSFPSWMTFSGTGSRYLTANGAQVDASDFTGLRIRVTRTGATPPTADSTPFAVTVYVAGVGVATWQDISLATWNANSQSGEPLHSMFLLTGTWENNPVIGGSLDTTSEWNTFVTNVPYGTGHVCMATPLWGAYYRLAVDETNHNLVVVPG